MANGSCCAEPLSCHLSHRHAFAVTLLLAQRLEEVELFGRRRAGEHAVPNNDCLHAEADGAEGVPGTMPALRPRRSDDRWPSAPW